MIGAVVIGRNEGDRLKRCLRSVVNRVGCTAYVDSGSTDGSVAFAHEIGVEVVELDPNRPFTMARGRNAGFQRLEQVAPSLEYVQFVDGDCEMIDGWIEAASDALSRQPDVGSVGGHRYEIARNESIYNLVTDMEWRGPPGESMYLGGDVLTRAQAFRNVGGYREHMIAGEDSEICIRLRSNGWKLLRLDKAATRHDAAITSFLQWWKRVIRAGYAYAEGSWLYRKSVERPWRREIWRNWFWGLILPSVTVAAAWPTHGLSVSLAALYPIWVTKIALQRKERFNDTASDAWVYAALCMLSKIPSAIGQLVFWWRWLRGTQATLIEYKTSDPSTIYKQKTNHAP